MRRHAEEAPSRRNTGTTYRGSFGLAFSLLVVLASIPAWPAEEAGGGKPAGAEGRWKFSLGGQLRLRGDFARNQNFTDFAFTPDHGEEQLLERTRLHGGIEDTAGKWKAFVQGQWYGRWGGRDERSEIDLYQGFVEWGKVLGFPLELKAGRQELSYGSTFLLGPNDFYNGLSWDGLKIRLQPTSHLSLDLLGFKMAQLNPGDPDIYLAGLYSTWTFRPENDLEGYILYHQGGFPFMHREFEIFDEGQWWYTLGIRLAGKAGGFDYELEPQFQWGKVKNFAADGRDSGRAFGGHLGLGYTFPLPWEPRLFAAYGFGTGDDDPADGKFKEFHGNIFNDHYLTGEMNMVPDLSGLTVEGIRASGIQVWVAGISVNPLPALNLILDLHRFLAHKAPPGFSRDLGWELNALAAAKLPLGFSLLLGLNRFFTGRFFQQAAGNGQDIDLAYLQVQFDF